MELQQLKYFYIIAQYESLTKAAEKLHISQPSLSRSLRALESELGVPLFDRVGRNIVLNDAGRFVLGRISHILDSAGSIKLEMEQFSYDKNMRLDVYIPVPLGSTAEIIKGFKEKHPDIRLRIASWPSPHFKNVMPHITFFASATYHRASNYYLLGEEEVVLAVAKDHPLAEKESVELASLISEPFVSNLSDSPFYNLAGEAFEQAGFRPEFVVEDQDFNRVLGYVAEGLGVALAPNITWFESWHDRVTYVPFTDVTCKRYLYLKWPANEAMNWATLQFREHVIDYFKENFGFMPKSPLEEYFATLE